MCYESKGQHLRSIRLGPDIKRGKTVRKKSNQKPTMSDIASGSKSSPIKVKAPRLPPGLHKQLFIDPDTGVQVVFDECGCGGTCGLLFSTDQEMSSLAKAAPVLESHKGQTASLSQWQSDGGELLLFAQGPPLPRRWS